MPHSLDFLPWRAPLFSYYVDKRRGTAVVYYPTTKSTTFGSQLPSRYRGHNLLLMPEIQMLLLERLPISLQERVFDSLPRRDQNALKAVLPAVKTYDNHLQAQDRALMAGLKGAKTAPDICAALENNQQAAMRLKAVDLHGRALGASGVQSVGAALVAYCKNMQRVSFADNAIIKLDVRNWALPASLEILNLSGNPELLDANAAVWDLPSGLLGLNLLGTPLPAAWARQDMLPEGLQALSLADDTNLSSWKMPDSVWHLTTTGSLSVVKTEVAGHHAQVKELVAFEDGSFSRWRSDTYQSDADRTAVAHHTFGPQPSWARLALTAHVTQSLTHSGLVIAPVFAGLMLSWQSHATLTPSTPAVYISIASPVVLPRLRDIVQLTGPRVATAAVPALQRASLGDVSGDVTPFGDVANEALYFCGSAAMRAAGAPFAATAAGVIWAATMAPFIGAGYLLQESISQSLQGVGLVEDGSSWDRGLSISTMSVMMMAPGIYMAIYHPNLFQRASNMVSSIKALPRTWQDRCYTPAQQKLRQATGWLTGAGV